MVIIYSTPQDAGYSSAASGSKIAPEADAPEVEITREMIAAGVLALSEYSSFVDLPADGAEKIVSSNGGGAFRPGEELCRRGLMEEEQGRDRR